MINYDTVSFPGLGIGEIQLNPVAIPQLGVEWYAIIICFGILIAVFTCERLAKRFGIKGDDVLDAVLFGLPAGIIGARLWYILGNLGEFDNFMDMISIWNGGLAIYGGIGAAILTGYFVCRHKKISLPSMLDLVAIGFLIGQIIGRWGNFMNVEVFGCETTLPWRMGVGVGGVVNDVFVHPLFLYESLWNLIGLFAVFCYMDSRKFKGELFLMYMSWYGLGRSWMELLRNPGYIMGENIYLNFVLACSLFALCLIALIWIYVKKPARLMLSKNVAVSNYESQFDYVSNDESDEPIEEVDVNELYKLDGVDDPSSVEAVEEEEKDHGEDY
ncbi:MAG: prolipoprotein diacylglyceryl transferase [Clostridia bacterium]|nr:prolipoprotein diacylglyceryl transferase [Clostridia bacterium]